LYPSKIEVARYIRRFAENETASRRGRIRVILPAVGLVYLMLARGPGGSRHLTSAVGTVDPSSDLAGNERSSGEAARSPGRDTWYSGISGGFALASMMAGF
jgi:hypothetical protein